MSVSYNGPHTQISRRDPVVTWLLGTRLAIMTLQGPMIIVCDLSGILQAKSMRPVAAGCKWSPYEVFA